MNKIDFLCLCFLIVNFKCIIVIGSKIDSSFDNLGTRRTLHNKSIRERETPQASATQRITWTTRALTGPTTSSEWITTSPTAITITYTKMTIPTIATMTFRPKPTQYSNLLKLIFNLKIEIDE